MLGTLLNKGKQLSNLNSETINTTGSTRLVALKFSQTLLFLAAEKFKPELLYGFDSYITNAKFNDFILGYTYLVTNGFPVGELPEDFSYKNFEDIFASVINELISCNDSDKRKKFAEIIHLLLLNPKLDLTHKFSLKSQEAEKTGIEHVFSTWVSETENADKKQILSDLLVHFIAITPDLTAITPGAKLHCVYALLSLYACASVKRYLVSEHFIGWMLSWVDIVDVVPIALSWSTAMSAGYFITLHLMDDAKSKSDPDKLSVNPDYLIGNFAIGMPFVLKYPHTFRQVGGKIIEGAVKEDHNYTDDYINRKLLLAKYAGTKAYMRSARMDIRLQLDLEALTKRYDALTTPNELIFTDYLAITFAVTAKRIFSEANFSAITEELKDDGKKEYFLKVYEMAEKGFIKLDLHTMYVMNEVFNQICYSGYVSSLAQTPPIIPVKDSLTFESFQYYFNVALLSKKDTSIRLNIFESFNNETAAWLKACDCVLDLNQLESAWKSVLTNFDKQFITPVPTIKQADEPEKNGEAELNMVDSIVDKAKSTIQGSISKVWNESKGLVDSAKQCGLTTAIGFCIVITFKYSALRNGSLIASAAISANYYYNPQIVGLKEFGQKFCSDGYRTGNDIYTGAGLYKTRILSYMRTKDGATQEEEIEQATRIERT